MKLDDVKKILSESYRDDWIDDGAGFSFTYKDDLNLNCIMMMVFRINNLTNASIRALASSRLLRRRYTLNGGLKIRSASLSRIAVASTRLANRYTYLEIK